MLPPQFITNKKGKRISVILPLRQYEQLLADLHDLAQVVNRRYESILTVAQIKAKMEIE